MAVGDLYRSSSLSDIADFPQKRQKRRNGMAYIFFGQSQEDISYLKTCFSGRTESCSSTSDSESASDAESETGLYENMSKDIRQSGTKYVDECLSENTSDEDEGSVSNSPCPLPLKRRLALADIFEGVPENKLSGFLAQYCKQDADSEFEIKFVDGCLSESTDDEDVEIEDSQSPINGPKEMKRRLALADIFEGVPESKVSDFLAQYCKQDSDEGCELETLQHVQRSRRFAMGNIFEGISENFIEHFLRNTDHNGEEYDFDNDTNGFRAPDNCYLSKRRGALADIFQNVINDDLMARLAQYSLDDNSSLSDNSDMLVDSDDMEVPTSGHSSDSSSPDESYLWRRRFALANIFEDIGAPSSPSRAQ